jgi:tetratricopeptide (TPR) repeat protein
MNVRCTRCRAVYSLEDVLFGGGAGAGGEFKPLPPSLQVECGRCAYVFEAPVPGRAPRASNPKLTPVPKAEPAATAARVQSGEKLARILKPRRPGEAPTAVEHTVRAPQLARAPADEEEGEFERAERMRQHRLSIGLFVAGAALLVIVALLVAPVVKRKLFGGLSKEASAKVQKALGKVLADDQTSLEQAVALYKEVRRLAPGEAQPEADLAYATLLLSESHRDEADRMEAAVKADTDQLNKLQIERPPGWEALSAGITDRVAKLAAEREPHTLESQRLLSEGRAAANAAIEEEPENLAVLRAQALFWAITDPEKGQRFLEQVHSRAGKDPLALYVRAAAALSGTRSRDKQDKALSALAEVQQAEPRFLRALYDPAAIAAARQLNGPARTALQRLLEQNPQHERARLLFAQLPAVQ